MKKYLINLADHLDKKGFYKEADYLDLMLNNKLRTGFFIFFVVDQTKIH